MDAARENFQRALELSVFPRALRGLAEVKDRKGRHGEATRLRVVADQLEHGHSEEHIIAKALELLSEVLPTG